MKRLVILVTTMFIVFNLMADEKGDEIARKNLDLKKQDDSFSVGLMVLINDKGSKKVRKVEMYSKKTKEGTNSFIMFLEPADVSGTKFLTIGHKNGDDEQRLYLPALGKVRKISSSNKGGSFMGSDLNYYDMEEHAFEDSNYKYIKDEKYNEKDCFVIETYSKDKNCPYSKQIFWISKEDYFAYKIECYEKKDNTLLKTLVIPEVKITDGIILQTKIVVDNHKEGSKTLFQMDNLKINIGIKDSVFSIQNLEK